MSTRRIDMAAPVEKFNIRWNNYTSVLQTVIRKLLADEQFVDVTLACEGRSVKCHRVVLSACSTYFEQIFRENPCKHLVIYLKDTKVWELQALVTFMYNGEVSVNQTKLANLVKAAEALKIKGLAPDTPEDVGQDKGSDDEEFDIRIMAGMKDSTPTKESHINPGKLQQLPSLSKPAPQKQILQQLKRKAGVPLPPKLVKMQRVGSPPKLLPQANGGLPGSFSSRSESENSRSNSSPPVKLQKQAFLDPTDQAVQKFEKSEIEDIYGEDFDGEELEDDFRDVEDDMEQVEDCDGGEVEDAEDILEGEDGQSSGSESDIVGIGGKRLRYGKDIRDSALSALNSGVSLRQCSEAFSIPRKTLSKWKAQELRETAAMDETDNIMLRRTGQECGDRAERLQKAMELAMSGTTVRQAAAHFDIPRTTLCAYMKRRGVAPKRNFLLASVGMANLPRRQLKNIEIGSSHGSLEEFQLSNAEYEDEIGE